MKYHLSFVEVAMLLDCIEAKLEILRGIKGTNERGKKYLEDELFRLTELFSQLEDPYLEIEELEETKKE